jgi:hypothetical protein
LVLDGAQVRNIEHRQKREMAEEEQRRARQAELDALEREKAAKIRLEEQAFQQQLQVAPVSCMPDATGGSLYNLRTACTHINEAV